MKYNRLSKYKIKKIIECFSEDITATSAGRILKLNRNTINSYYAEFRKKILESSIKEQAKELGEFEPGPCYPWP
jgi:transposase